MSEVQRISVIVPTRNRKDSLRVCLAALRDQQHPDFELVVVDDASSDETAAMVANEFPEVRLFVQRRQGGAAATRNRGIEEATSWSDAVGHAIDEWGLQPSEDFAEVMVMLWSDGRWTPRTELAGDPTIEDLAAVLDLLDPPLAQG